MDHVPLDVQGCSCNVSTMKALMLVVVLGVGCGKQAGDSGEAPPAKPAHGAPVAFIAKELKEGDNFKGEVVVKGYNFHDKAVGSYTLLFRYYDDKGAVIKITPGTPFEKTFGFMGLSGNKFKCDAKSWCTFTVKGLDVPAGAKKADVVAVKVAAYKDANTFDDKQLIDMSLMSWPGESDAPSDGAKPAGDPPTAPAGAGSAAGSAAP